MVKQTRAPLELIVVDDGSTDDSAAIAESFGPPVRVIRQANQGESVARNVGIAEARGDYLVFLDADDLLDPRALEEQARAVVALPGAVGLMGFAWFEQDPGEPTMVKMPDVEGFFPRIIETNLGPPHTWIVPRALPLEVGGFDPALRWFEDWEFWSRVALSGVSLVTTPFLGAYYRQHRASQLATTRDADRARGHTHVMERLCVGMLRRDELIQRHADDLFWCAWTSLHRARVRGVPWEELRPLASRIEELVHREPDRLKGVRFAQMIRVLGVRWAEAIRSLAMPEETVPGRAVAP